MTSKETLLVNYLNEEEKAYELLKNKGVDMSKTRIWQLLQNQLDCVDEPNQVLYKKLSAIKIVELVEAFYEINGKALAILVVKEPIIEADLGSNDIIKATIRSNGEIWIIHKNDLDPFPSDPHAHNLDRNLKLDLSNGTLYRKRKLVDSIRKKQLITIRELIEKRNIGVPTLCI